MAAAKWILVAFAVAVGFELCTCRRVLVANKDGDGETKQDEVPLQNQSMVLSKNDVAVVKDCDPIWSDCGGHCDIGEQACEPPHVYQPVPPIVIPIPIPIPPIESEPPCEPPATLPLPPIVIIPIPPTENEPPSPIEPPAPLPPIVMPIPPTDADNEPCPPPAPYNNCPVAEPCPRCDICVDYSKKMDVEYPPMEPEPPF